MDAVILIGIQASGKTSFYRERFFDTHVRISLDMLRTRHREASLMQACLDMRQPFVVDNTNPTAADRKRYILIARDHGFRVVGYYFQSRIDDCRRRNERRAPGHVFPDRGLRGTHSRLVLPGRGEGFDEIFYVEMTPQGFKVSEWSDEV
ncbi:MAG: ATP-binding protein [Phycisphaerales bacterium]|nr:ATP-binding protein [Phycisphaerales bacterium]